MTKALTGTAAMQMVEQGKLDLATPASRILPQLDETQVLVGWANVKPITRPPKWPITLRHLLTHTAGFAYEHWNNDIQQYHSIRRQWTSRESGRARTPLCACRLCSIREIAGNTASTSTLSKR